MQYQVQQNSRIVESFTDIEEAFKLAKSIKGSRVVEVWSKKEPVNLVPVDSLVQTVEKQLEKLKDLLSKSLVGREVYLEGEYPFDITVEKVGLHLYTAESDLDLNNAIQVELYNEDDERFSINLHELKKLEYRD